MRLLHADLVLPKKGSYVNCPSGQGRLICEPVFFFRSYAFGILLDRTSDLTCKKITFIMINEEG